MAILRNSAKCVDCGTEIESRHGHDFVTHACAVNPRPLRDWSGDELVIVPGKTTWSFAVDGGKNYLRRVGDGFEDTSTFDDDGA